MRDPRIFSPWVGAWIVITIFAFAFLGCPTESIIDGIGGSGNDTTAPVPGDNGAIVASNETTWSVSLTWTAATDDRTAGSELQYKVYYSIADNIASATAATLNGTPATVNWTDALTSYTVPSLTENTDYYFVVIVQDEAGNPAAYVPVLAQTALSPDTTAPDVSGATLSTLSNSYDTIEVTWTAATDDRDAPSELTYTLYCSPSDNLTSIAETQASTAEVDSSGGSPVIISPLAYGTEYYLNLLVEDSAGNVAEYGDTSQVTLNGPRINASTDSWSETEIVVDDYYSNPTSATQNITIENDDTFLDRDQPLEISAWSIANTTVGGLRSVIFSLSPADPTSPPIDAIDPGSTYEFLTVHATTVAGDGTSGHTETYQITITSNDPTQSSFPVTGGIYVDYS